MPNQTLIYLDQIKDNLESVDYEMIYKSIADLKDKAIPTAILRKGWYIDRVRINKPNEVFTNHMQVSYIHDKTIIDNYVDFGRANEPKQTVFYGAVESPNPIAKFNT